MKSHERQQIFGGVASLIVIVLALVLLYSHCEHDQDRRAKCIEQTHDANGCVQLFGKESQP